MDPRVSGNLASSAIHIQSPMSRTHKSNFSVPALHGAQSAVILGSHHPDSKSLHNSGGSHSHSSSSSSAAVAPWTVLDVSKHSEEVRNPRTPAIPLLLKRPTFKNLAKTRNPSFKGQRTPTLMSQPRCHDTCVLESVRFKNADPWASATDPSPYGPQNSLNGSLPATPCSGFVNSPPSTQSCPDVRELELNTPLGLPSSVHNLESRNFPPTSQDDISLHSQVVDKKHKSLKRQSRRASLSLTSALSPSAPSQTPNLTSSGKIEFEHSISTAVTPTASGYTADISPVSPLSPITFQSVPSSELDPTRIPVADLITSNDFEDPTPTSITASHPEMYSDALSTNSTCVNSSRSSSQSHSSCRDQFSSVAKTSCSVTPEPSSTTPAQIKVSPTQAKEREEEEETLVNEFAEGGYNETCITRSEEVWMGYWNRGSMTLVIDDLRELRAPKFTI